MSSAAGMKPAAVSPDVLRVIAHELRQPLGAIESIAYYLTLVLPHDPKVHEQLTRIQQLVEQSNWILTSGLQLADPSHAAPEQVDIEQLIAQIVSARSGLLDPPLQLELAGNLPLVLVNPDVARMLIENLLTLFRQFASPVTLRTFRDPACGVQLDFTSTATGFRSEAALAPGASLSLASARRIVEAHGGSLEVSVDRASGIQVRVMLP